MVTSPLSSLQFSINKQVRGEANALDAGNPRSAPDLPALV
jgi:hypothetical protein